ncbi:MAG: transposase [Lachnospiraceae bacterium]|nr:transposase [Lachnospiraceae bacterium]
MEKDVTKKSCLSDKERYADLINGLIFQGKQLVQAGDLTDMDSQTGMWGRGFLRGRWQRRLKYRDLIKKAAMGVGFVVIGIENQDEVNYLMPLRNMAYDTAEYERQAAVIRKRVRKRKGITRAEFLSGFTRESRLMPCITLVLYYGKDWDGSPDLHGILDMQGIPEEMKSYINNYSIHLIEVRKLQNTDVFKTDLKQVFDFIKYSEDKKKLKELIEAEPAYQEMDEDAYDMAAAYANAEELIAVKKYHGKDGKVNMCKAIQEMLEDERQEGRQEGIQALIETCQELGMTKEQTADKVSQKFKISKANAGEYMEKYWH